MPWLAFMLGPSYPIKLLYYAFEGALAILLARHVERAKRGNVGAGRRPEVVARAACLFLLLPVTWVITSLHGNFDVIPTFFTIAAFLLLAAEPSETSAIVAGGSIGLAAMARTFPVVFAGPLFVYVLRRNRWTTAVVASALTVLPSFLSMAPMYLPRSRCDPARAFVPGIRDGRWGLCGRGEGRGLRSAGPGRGSGLHPVFYVAILALSVGIAVGSWRGRLGILRRCASRDGDVLLRADHQHPELLLPGSVGLLVRLRPTPACRTGVPRGRERRVVLRVRRPSGETRPTDLVPDRRRLRSKVTSGLPPLRPGSCPRASG